MSTFPAAGIRFLTDLSVNNSRDWFQANRAEFETTVQAPSQALLEAFRVHLGALMGGEFEGKVYRIHRDVRFSKDKTPYSPFVRFSLWRSGADPKMDCSFHVSIEPTQLIVGVGIWEFSPEELARFWSRVQNGEVDRLVEDMGGVRLDEPERKKLPKDAPSDSDHFRRKGLTMWIDLPAPDMDIIFDQWNEPLARLSRAFRWFEKR